MTFLNILKSKMKSFSKVKRILFLVLLKKIVGLNLSVEPLKKMILVKETVIFFASFPIISKFLRQMDAIIYIAFLSILFQRLRGSFFGESREKQIEVNLTIWEEVFLKLELPIAVLSGEGDLILHNSPFSKLKMLPINLLEIPDGMKSKSINLSIK